MDMIRTSTGLMLALLLTACGASAPATETVDTDTAGTDAPTIGPVPYSVSATPPAPSQPADDQPPTEAELILQGATLYATNCAPCHQPNGEGNLTIFPALNRNAFVTLAAPQPVIDTVLHGRQIMPAFAPTLNDQELAAVISYIRNAWNNDASTITADEVETMRNRDVGTAAEISTGTTPTN